MAAQVQESCGAEVSPRHWLSMFFTQVRDSECRYQRVLACASRRMRIEFAKVSTGSDAAALRNNRAWVSR